MAFDQAGEGGLRRRLNMAVEPPGSAASVAQALGVSESLIVNYLSNPEYVLGSEAYNQILTNLSSLPDNTHTRESTNRWEILFQEKAQWTAGDVASLDSPEGAENVVVFVFDDEYAQDVAAFGPVALDTFSVQQVIEAATGGNPDLLLTVVWYVPN